MAVLEVLVTSVADAERAEAGGADRVLLVGSAAQDRLSPEPALVAAVREATSLHLRVLLRLRDGYSTDGGEAMRLTGLASTYRDRGADGLALGFLNGLGGIDLSVCHALLGNTDCPWTFDRAFDQALDRDQAWGELELAERLDSVETAGSARGLDQGLDEIVSRARGDEWVRQLTMVGGDVAPSHLPWLLRAGVRQCHVGAQVRPRGDLDAPVDHELVHSWRTLIDAEMAYLTQRETP
ncbi:MAG: copper homeostasis protein CutC [Propionibacteriaceae bacterium]